MIAGESGESSDVDENVSVWPVENPTGAQFQTAAQFQRPRIRVLLVEHDDLKAQVVAAALDSSGFELLRCRSAESALAALAGTDIVVLHLELPDVDGLSFLAEIRLATCAPTLVYSERQDVDSVVSALQCGADDYMIEPVRPLELRARVQAMRRRAVAATSPEQIVQVGDVEVHLAARTVVVGGQPVSLTPMEFDVLAVLARCAGTTVSRRDIMHDVWGRATLSTTRVLDVHMTTLRAKLARPNLLLTVRGFGYRLGS